MRGEDGRYLGSSEASSVDWVTRAEAYEMEREEAEEEAAGFAGAEVEEAVEEGRGDGQGVCVRGVRASASCGDDVSLAADARARVGGDVPPAAGRRLGEEGAVGRVEGERAVAVAARTNGVRVQVASDAAIERALAYLAHTGHGPSKNNDGCDMFELADVDYLAMQFDEFAAAKRTANPVHDVPKTDDGEPIAVGDRLVSNHGIYKGRIMRVLEVDARDASCANIVVTPERDALANEHRIAVHGSFFTKLAHAEPVQGPGQHLEGPIALGLDERALRVLPEHLKGSFWDDVRKRLATEFLKLKIELRDEARKCSETAEPACSCDPLSSRACECRNEGARQERASIVAWLRAQAAEARAVDHRFRCIDPAVMDLTAEHIENGRHTDEKRVGEDGRPR